MPARDAYEPPAIVVLGTVAELTQLDQAGSEEDLFGLQLQPSIP